MSSESVFLELSNLTNVIMVPVTPEKPITLKSLTVNTVKTAVDSTLKITNRSWVSNDNTVVVGNPDKSPPVPSKQRSLLRHTKQCFDQRSIDSPKGKWRFSTYESLTSHGIQPNCNHLSTWRSEMYKRYSERGNKISGAVETNLQTATDQYIINECKEKLRIKRVKEGKERYEQRKSDRSEKWGCGRDLSYDDEVITFRNGNVLC
jgi:hypothetical protein